MNATEIDDLKTRYARQISLPEVGEEGQMCLARKRVAIIGAGGLGSALLPLLVGAGVGYLTLCDDDSISVSNLPRQTLYTTHEVGRSKAHCAAERLRAANPHCDITAYSERLTEANATRLIGGGRPSPRRYRQRSDTPSPRSLRLRAPYPVALCLARGVVRTACTLPPRLTLTATETSSPREIRKTTQAPHKPPSP